MDTFNWGFGGLQRTKHRAGPRVLPHVRSAPVVQRKAITRRERPGLATWKVRREPGRQWETKLALPANMSICLVPIVCSSPGLVDATRKHENERAHQHTRESEQNDDETGTGTAFRAAAGPVRAWERTNHLLRVISESSGDFAAAARSVDSIGDAGVSVDGGVRFEDRPASAGFWRRCLT